jgi:hypothetical protein
MSDEFLNAEGAHAYTLLSGPNESRLVIGSTEMIYHPKPPPPKESLIDEKAGPVISPVKSIQKVEEPPPAPVPDLPATMRSMDGWVIAASPVPAYKDPCVAPAPTPHDQGY